FAVGHIRHSRWAYLPDDFEQLLGIKIGDVILFAPAWVVAAGRDGDDWHVCLYTSELFDQFCAGSSFQLGVQYYAVDVWKALESAQGFIWGVGNKYIKFRALQYKFPC